MKKEIRFSTSLSTEEFDKAITQMQQKLKSVYQSADQTKSQMEQKANLSRVGLGGPVTAQDRIKLENEEKRGRQQADSFIKQQLKTQEEIGKELLKQEQLKKRIEKSSESQIEKQKKLLEIEKQMGETRAKMAQSENSIVQALERRQKAGFDGVGGFGGALQRGQSAFEGARLGGGNIFQAAGAGAKGLYRGMAGMGLGGLALGLGALGGGLSTLGYAGEYINQQDRAILAAQGSVRGQYGQQVRDIFSGQGLEQALYSSDTKKAMEDASKEMSTTKKTDLLKLAGAAVGLVAGAALTATGIGAGAGIPMLLAAGATAVGSGGYLAKQGYDRFSGKYDVEKEQQRAAAFEQNLQARKNLDPLRRAALDRFQQEMMPNLSTQRAAGLGDQELQNVLLEGTNAGFTSQMTRSAISNILQAGGSTAAVRGGGANLANTLERNFNLTNASTAIGRLSSLTGNAASSEQAMIKILAEGQRLGLDSSKFAQEQRMFVDRATEVIQRSGATGIMGQSGVVEGFSRFVANSQTTAGIQAAKSAYDITQQISSESGGARGALQAAAINRDSSLSKLNMDQRNSLLQLSEEAIRAGGPLIEGMAVDAGLSLSEFQEKALSVKQGARATRSDIQNVADKLKALGPGAEGTDEYKSLAGKYIAGMGYDVGAISQLKPEEQRAFIRGNVFGTQGMTPEELEKFNESARAVSGQIKAGPERLADKVIAGQAAGDQSYIQTMKLFTPEVDKAASSLKDLSAQVTKAMEAFKNIDPKDTKAIADFTKTLAEAYGRIGVGTTPTGTDLLQEKTATPGR